MLAWQNYWQCASIQSNADGSSVCFGQISFVLHARTFYLQESEISTLMYVYVVYVYFIHIKDVWKKSHTPNSHYIFYVMHH